MAVAAGQGAIVCAGLTKDYGSTRALDGVDLELRAGEIFGYLGSNGAGKTTTIRCLLGLIRPTAGRATVLGLDSETDSVAVRRRTGYLPGTCASTRGSPRASCSTTWAGCAEASTGGASMPWPSGWSATWASAAGPCPTARGRRWGSSRP